MLRQNIINLLRSFVFNEAASKIITDCGLCICNGETSYATYVGRCRPVCVELGRTICEAAPRIGFLHGSVKWCAFVNTVMNCTSRSLLSGRVHLKCDGTRWPTGGEVKRKLANVVGSQYPSHYLGTWFIDHYYCCCAYFGWTDAPSDLNGLVRFAERRYLVSAPVPSHFKRSLTYWLAE